MDSPISGWRDAPHPETEILLGLVPSTLMFKAPNIHFEASTIQKIAEGILLPAVESLVLNSDNMDIVRSLALLIDNRFLSSFSTRDLRVGIYFRCPEADAKADARGIVKVEQYGKRVVERLKVDVILEDWGIGFALVDCKTVEAAFVIVTRSLKINRVLA
ncbi:hypothetical protein DXG01_005970 [Tephrocybe rancida]|nr:hypothetical protein DXG01_005970 [Tephrocybe rancida]